MRPDILSRIPLTDHQIRFILDIAESTWYRKLQTGQWKRAEWLVLTSLATGLPVSVSNSRMWEKYEFCADGYLRGPSNYPIGPGDLWVYELLMKNDVITRMCDRFEIPRPKFEPRIVRGQR